VEKRLKRARNKGIIFFCTFLLHHWLMRDSVPPAPNFTNHERPVHSPSNQFVNSGGFLFRRDLSCSKP